MMNLRWIVAAILAVALLLAIDRYGDARYAAGRAAVQKLREADRQTAQEAYDRAAKEAAALAAADQLKAQEVENALRTQITAADADARNLARRLRDATRARAGCGPVPGPADPAPGAEGDGGESGRDETVERAIEDVFAACARDAIRLDGWDAWWAGIAANRL